MKTNRKQAAEIDIRTRVLTLELSPGLMLDESSLSAHYGLSRTPLREVLQRLAGEGYLTIEANRGASVSAMDLSTMRQFFQSAPMIYAAIARLAVEQATSTQIDQLKSIQRQFCLALKSRLVSDMAAHNHHFHELIGEMAANPYLLPSLQRLLIDHTRMSHTFYKHCNPASDQRIELASQQHDEMIESIEKREAARAVDLTLAHWELSRNELTRYVHADPLPHNLSDQIGRHSDAV